MAGYACEYNRTYVCTYETNSREAIKTHAAVLGHFGWTDRTPKRKDRQMTLHQDKPCRWREDKCQHGYWIDDAEVDVGTQPTTTGATSSHVKHLCPLGKAASA